MADPYTFTQPIRYYKANDPYYYEVDNLPIRQLEENILYVKNELEASPVGAGGGSGGNFMTDNSEVSLYNIKELRPKAAGGRTVTVNAGRFVSRVNDAFNIQHPFNKLVYTAKGKNKPYDVIHSITQQWSEADRNNLWTRFITGGTGNQLNITGLEYTYTFQLAPGGLGGNYGTNVDNQTTGVNVPAYDLLMGVSKGCWPGGKYGPVVGDTLSKVLSPRTTYNTDPYSYNFTTLSTIHLAFVQMWRGVFRTAVVDFPEVSIEIPGWSDDDYTYINDSGTKVVIPGANQRIDLLVAYSLPIDTSSTTISDYGSNYSSNPPPVAKTLTAPALGIIRGAGLGIKRLTGDTVIPKIDTLPGTTGNKMTVGVEGDEYPAANEGITDINGTKVHGTFPSPDDLVNMAPLLALDVDSQDFQLIGQAALPIAYVVTTSGAANTAITQANIIDIRPFLRTTEFTYNERAGVAAANPPLSMANPAVGAFELQNVINQMDFTRSTLKPSKSGRALYTDFVMGGLAYGVEGTLLTMCDGPQDDEDPFGSVSVAQTAYTGGNGVAYNFGAFTSSKAFLEEVSQNKRQAFLEYIYNHRQAELKSWLSNPNQNYGNTRNKTYLGLPPGGTGRNIPLYPEWDMPMDTLNYATVLGQPNISTSPNLNSPPPTWWMWIEGINSNRSLSYVPGAVTSTLAGNTSTYLDKKYGFAYGESGHSRGSGQELGRAMISVVTKAIEVKFPSWVVDYDVLVEYVNCGPVTSTDDNSPTSSQRNQTQYGLGSGLYINKEAIKNDGTAVFRINSAAQPWPDTGDGTNVVGMMADAGKITDVEGEQVDGAQRKGSITEDKLWQHLSYSVCLPGNIQTKYTAELQSGGTPVVTRYMPKVGAAFYPTVKFTVIAYDTPAVTRNTNYGDTNTGGLGWTLIQNIAAGNPNLLLPNANGYFHAPLQIGNSKVNLSNLTD